MMLAWLAFAAAVRLPEEPCQPGSAACGERRAEGMADEHLSGRGSFSEGEGAELHAQSVESGAPHAVPPPGFVHSSSLFVIEAIWDKTEDSLAVFFTSSGDDPKGSMLQKQKSNVKIHMGRRVASLADDAIPTITLKNKVLQCERVKEGLKNDNHFTGILTIMYCKLDGKADSIPGDMELLVGGSKKVVVHRESFASGPFQATTRLPPKPGSTNRELRISACATHLSGPKSAMILPFAEDILAYYKVAGLSHVYWTVHNREVHAKLTKMLSSYIANGFLSLILFRLPGLSLQTQDALGLADIGFDAGILGVSSGEQDGWAFKAIQNNLCLYHAKNWDDLLMIQDFDELMVADKARLPQALAANFKLRAVPGASAVEQARSLCYITLCPRVMFPADEEKQRMLDGSPAPTTLAAAYPTMDGGVEGGADMAPNQVKNAQCGRKYAEIYRKSLAVVRNTMYVGLHDHGSCQRPGKEDGFRQSGESYVPDEYLYLDREDVQLEHYSQIFELGRFEPNTLIVADAPGGPSFSDIHRNLDTILTTMKLPTHVKAPSSLKENWADRIAAERRLHAPGDVAATLQHEVAEFRGEMQSAKAKARDAKVEEIARLQKELEEEARSKRQLQDDLKSVVAATALETVPADAAAPETAPAEATGNPEASAGDVPEDVQERLNEAMRVEIAETEAEILELQNAKEREEIEVTEAEISALKSGGGDASMMEGEILEEIASTEAEIAALKNADGDDASEDESRRV